MNIKTETNKLGTFSVVTASKSVFSKETVLKASYSLTDDLFIYITSDKNNYFISLEHKKPDGNLRLASIDFSQLLIEQEMRQVVIKETGVIRDTIMKKAFSEAAKGLKLTPKSIPNDSSSYKKDDKQIMSLQG